MSVLNPVTIECCSRRSRRTPSTADSCYRLASEQGKGNCFQPDVAAVPQLQRHQLDSCPPGLRSPQVSSVLEGTRSVVFFEISAGHSVVHPLASRAQGADGNFIAYNFDSTAGLLEKCPVPASRPQAPGAHEYPPFYHHNPNADETMGLIAGADSQHFTAADGGQDFVREPSSRLHLRAAWYQGATPAKMTR